MSDDQRDAVAARLLANEALSAGCAFRPLFDQATSRWATLIIAALVGEPHRFAQLHTKVGGISQKMLSQNLKVLVRAGLVAREVAPTVPPQVTYSLTALGESLSGPLTDLIGWFGNNASEIFAAQAAYDDAQ
jgi:DNA-binding HxlR family transcriptional regulator